MEWEQCFAKVTIPEPGLREREAAASAGRRGHKMGEAGKFQGVKSYVEKVWGHMWKRLGHGSPRGYYYSLLAQEQRAKALLCLFSYFNVKEPP